MSKYDRLAQYLEGQSLAEVPMRFSDIERITGAKLPPSAYRHRPWWSNNPRNSVMTQVWLKAGYRTERVDMEAQKLVFRRAATGMEESHRPFRHEEPQMARKPRRSPLFGCMKGTFTIASDWDLTRPALDPEELSAWEESLDHKASLIEAGKRK